MKYRYRFTTKRRMAGSVDFEDFLEAVAHMNQDYEQRYDICSAYIIDIENDKIVCSKRKKF